MGLGPVSTLEADPDRSFPRADYWGRLAALAIAISIPFLFTRAKWNVAVALGDGGGPVGQYWRWVQRTVELKSAIASSCAVPDCR